MKRILSVAAVLVASSLFVFGQSKDEQSVRQYFDELNAAMLKDDFAARERLYADDYTNININGEVQTKTQWLTNQKNSPWSFASLNREIESVRVMGDTAVVVSHVNFVGKDRKTGETFKGEHRTTTTLARRNGRWVSVAAQTTRTVTPTDEKTLNQFIDSYLAALTKNSADAVAPFLGGQYVRVGADGSTINREQALAAFRSGDLKYDSVTADERTWRMFGREMAISTSRVTVKAKLKGQDISGIYRATTVLRKGDVDRWVLVSTHLSRLDGK